MKIIKSLPLLVLLLLTATLHAADPITLAFFADNRGLPSLTPILKSIKALPTPPTALLSPGDIDPPHTTRKQISDVFGDDFPWYPIVGNHELEKAEDLPYLRAYFATLQKSNATVLSGPEGSATTTYSFDLGPVHFAAINEYWDGTTAPKADGKAAHDVVPQLRAWLAADLAKSSQPFKIVLGHDPAFPTPDADHGDMRHEKDSLTAHPDHRDAFWKLLEEQHVTAYICGHTHRYSITHPTQSSVLQIDVGQARGDVDWKYDTFIVLSATDSALTFTTYRNLKTRGSFEVTRTLMLASPPTQPR